MQNNESHVHSEEHQPISTPKMNRHDRRAQQSRNRKIMRKIQKKVSLQAKNLLKNPIVNSTNNTHQDSVSE